MGYLVSIIGNSGVGKTTLAERLAEQEGFFTAKEELDQRPFQAAYARDLKRYALANQIDFLLFRAEQERQIRFREGIGVQDGGMDQDFQCFTRLFHQAGYLTDDEFALCQRLYSQLRNCLAGPELFIYLEAPIEVISSRYKARERQTEIARKQDLETLQSLLDNWLEEIEPSRVITINASADDYLNPADTHRLSQNISTFFSDNL